MYKRCTKKKEKERLERVSWRTPYDRVCNDFWLKVHVFHRLITPSLAMCFLASLHYATLHGIPWLKNMLLVINMIPFSPHVKVKKVVHSSDDRSATTYSYWSKAGDAARLYILLRIRDGSSSCCGAIAIVGRDSMS